MLLDPLFDLQRQLGLYEFETRRIVRRLVVPGVVVFDVGAGDGYESLAYARLGARVYAFDPDQVVVARLRKNIELNPELVAQITVFMQRFSASDLLPRADFVKIDVDGGERELLEDLLDVPAMLIETHSADLEAACISFLSDHGYQTTVIPNARWRLLYPEWRPIEHNRWLVAERRSTWRGQATLT